MNEQQFVTLVQNVLSRVRDELKSTPVLPKAYIMMPVNWQTQSHSQCLEILQKLQGVYHMVAVISDADNDDSADALCSTGVRTVIKRGEAVFPSDDFLTIFPVACRNLVVKTALCIQDDFESKWIANCIAHGRALYMRKETPLFTGKEPEVYKRRIQSYYKDAEAFGVKFDMFESMFRDMRKLEQPGGIQKKRIITTNDLEEFSTVNEMRLYQGDIVTALAEERAKELGINILYM